MAAVELSGVGHGLRWVIYSVLVSVSVAFVGLLPLFMQDLKIRRFFGLVPEQSITLAIGSYGSREDYDPEAPPEKFLFKKRYKDENYFLRGVEHSVGLNTAIYMTEAASVLDSLSHRRVTVIGDQSPAGDLTKIQGPLVCLGSPTSNYLTHDVLMLLPGEVRPEFTTDVLTWLGDTYEPDEDLDYGVIARIRTKERTAFVCAGVDEEGTVGSLRHLQKNWSALPMSWRLDVSFVAVFSVSRKERSIRSKVGVAYQVPTSVSWQLP